MTNEEIIKRLESIASAELVCDGLKVGAITKECFESIQETARLAIAALSRDRWISVDDRLPEMHDEVLICNGDYGKTELGFATVAVWGGSDWVNTWDRKGTIHCVTHWRPLTEPPKEYGHEVRN